MTTQSETQNVIRSVIPARIDRLPWSPLHTRMVIALGVAWILDGLEITIASAVADTLAQPELASLQQRLAIHAALSPLTEQEAADYLDRRMRAAGARATLFRPAAVAKLFEKTRGVPRLINNLATAALLAAAATGRKHVDVQDVDDAFFDSENA